MPDWENLPKDDPQEGDYRVSMEKGYRWGWWWHVEQYGNKQGSEGYNYAESYYFPIGWYRLSPDGYRVGDNSYAKSNRWSSTAERAEKRAAKQILRFEKKALRREELWQRNDERLAQSKYVNMRVYDISEDLR